MDMKKLLTIVSEGKQQVSECGMMDQAPMSPAIPSVPPVSMNVNLNAQGIDNIKELIQLMHKADSPLAAGPVGGEVPPMPLPTVGMDMPLNVSAPKAEPAFGGEPAGDMDPLDALVKKAGIAVAKPAAPAGDQEEGAATDGSKSPLGQMADEVKDMADELADHNAEEGFENEPEEEYGDLDDVTATGNDLASKGDEAPKVNGGGNPFKTTESQIKSNLMKLYMEVKEGKKAKKDYDKDGKIESEKDEVIGSRRKAAGLDEAEENRAPAKKKERETTLPSGAKVKTTTVQGWQSQKADKAANKERKASYKD